MLTQESREFIRDIVQSNYRGVRTSDLVCDLQHIKESIKERLTTSNSPKDDATLFSLYCQVGNITKELKRRHNMQIYDTVQDNKFAFQAIKEKVGIEGLVDIIGRHTEVYVNKRTWQFKCPFGEDKHPSGVFYKNELRWHCFRCNRGGDCFDALMVFENMDRPHALHTLARYVGIDLQPIKRSQPQQNKSTKQGYKGLLVGT